jgi:hypothetical protein
VLTVAALGLVAFSAGQPRTGAVLFTAAAQYEPLAWMTGGERFPSGAAIMLKDASSAPRKLVAGFAATADPNVSFDGKSLLFAGKKSAGDRWQIWEMPLPSGRPRHITSSNDDAVRPMYLPEGKVVYAQKQNGAFILQTQTLATRKTQQISFVPGSVMVSDVLRDGRILLEAGHPLGSGNTPELYTVYPDGSGIESYRCDHGNGRYAGKQVTSGDVVFTHGSKLSRFTSALAQEAEIPAPAGEYAGDVLETPAGQWILPWRADASQSFALKQWQPGAKEMSAVAATTGMNLLQPVLLSARTTPNRYPSALHDWAYSNVLTLNAYESKYKFEPNSIASVRVYSQDASGQEKALGTAPVEKDGSLYVRVPGNRPVKFELLDAEGKTLKRQAGWTWMRGGEQRVCIGCHTGPERAPDNAVPAVLLRSTVPADMTGAGSTTKTGGR